MSSLRHAALACVAGVMLLSACAGGDAARPDGLARATVTSAPPVEPAPATATVVPAVTPTRSAALDALLVPGPTLPLPDRFFFRNDHDLWQHAVDGATTQLTRDLRLGPWAQTPSGSRAAAVVYRDDRGSDTEEIRLVASNGAISNPVYGPVATEGPRATASIVSLSWSWDETALAVAFSDGGIATLTNLTAEGQGARAPAPVGHSDGSGPVKAIAWAPSGAGIAFLAPAEGGGGSLAVIAHGDASGTVIDISSVTDRSTRAFAWLPGRGRIAFVQETDEPASRAPESIFTIAPDGSALELLVSAARFAPAARIVTLSPSPDGRLLAFTVYTPDDAGRPAFDSLWILAIDPGELSKVSVRAGYRVVDMSWTSSGLVWRGIDINERAPGDNPAYTGSEPFILGRHDLTSGAQVIVFQSEMVGR